MTNKNNTLSVINKKLKIILFSNENNVKRKLKTNSANIIN